MTEYEALIALKYTVSDFVLGVDNSDFITAIDSSLPELYKDMVLAYNNYEDNFNTIKEEL